MALPFRRRIFVVLVAMTAIPVLLAVVGWMMSLGAFAPAAGARASLESVGRTAVELRARIDTAQLAPAERAALEEHLAEVSQSLSLARRAEAYTRYYKAGFAAAVAFIAAAVLFAAVRLAGHLSRQLSRPIDELVGWTRLIREREALPAGPPRKGAPEFQALRHALREMADTLSTARSRELEAERLRAFREMARRVAHEIKNPLTAMRIAVDQLERSSGPDGRPANAAVAVDVLNAETDRLERLAKDFSDLGRMPEGPSSEVDVAELLQELARTAVPSGVSVALRTDGRRAIQGHYEPLRRAFSNLLRNAAEAMGGRGAIEVAVAGGPDGLAVTIADHGPGVPADLRDQVFEPYVTTKPEGTGLGLALVRQTVEAHGGAVTLSETPGGGATFTVTLAR
jgi:signal transduction histidine kinase